MSTIEITGCSTSTTRMILKREMERFGHVDVCHMGNRDNPSAEPPWVRFADPKAADSALDAIKAGLVIIDGFAINAQKSNRRGPPLVSREPREAEVGSRELFLQRSRGGGGGGGGGRSRSRRRGGSRDRSRGKRSRSRGRGSRDRSRGKRSQRRARSSSRSRGKDRSRDRSRDRDRDRRR
mmetsp:Transcript_94643/g.265016  ORF Transcript_94643/g.265016 Transcript_94643/m.265016 type:complete len:180 (+) Transcript_94643:66-605(+)